MSGSGGGLSGVSIDTDNLQRKASMLALIAEDFEMGGEHIDALRAAIGRNDIGVVKLGNVIEASADQWSARRREMQERIDKLAAHVGTTATTFDQLDVDMAGAIRAQGSSSTAGGSGNAGSSGHTPRGVV